MQENEKQISVAPMMDWTDRHCRYFHRLIAPHVRLYTEMVTTGALIHGDRRRHLDFSAAEHPVALQLGGSDPSALAECSRIGAGYGYDEINLNCGCPSDRVQSGAFGACLMKEPSVVARCVAAMSSASHVPVTVKCRIGVDDCDNVAFLDAFVRTVAQAGCGTFIIHARKAWLQGLSPRENREVPPLDYDLVYKIKQDLPHLRIVLNGGLKTVEDMKTPMSRLDGVMIGREAYQNPWLLADIEQKIFGAATILTRESVARAMIPYMEDQGRASGTPAKSVTRHMLGLFNGLRGGKAWRRTLSEKAHLDMAPAELIEDALQSVLLSSDRSSRDLRKTY